MNLGRCLHHSPHTVSELRPVLAQHRQLDWKLSRNFISPDHGEDHDLAQSKPFREAGDQK